MAAFPYGASAKPLIRCQAAQIARCLALLHPGTAPALTGHLLACKQWATACRVGCFALVQRAVVAGLSGGVFGVFDFVGFGRVGFVAECCGLGIGLKRTNKPNLRLALEFRG